MQKLLASSFTVSAGGLRYRIVSDELPMLHEVSSSYGQFTSSGATPVMEEDVRVLVSVATLRACTGKPILDADSWRIFERDGDRVLQFQTRLMTEPLYEASFRPGLREVRLACAPSLIQELDGRACVESQFCYPLDQVLTMYALADDGLIVHAAGLERGGQALALPGVSGAGKSTIVRLTAGRGGLAALSDDRVILRVRGPVVELHGTPWPGEAGVAENRWAQARGILFLEHGERNAVRPIEVRETLARLLPTASLPWFDHEQIDASLRACDRIVRMLPAGVLTFTPDTAVAELLESCLDVRAGSEWPGTV
jgi:hypothetical protein